MSWLEARARRTDEILAAVAGNENNAPHIVDHPVLSLNLAGAQVYLEPDALAFRAGDRLELVEIKSYPIIDGQADPRKLAATARQAAVYVIALRAALQRLGFDPDLLRSSVILVAPRNFGRQPVAHRVPLRKKVVALMRVLSAVPQTSSLLEGLVDDFTLDVSAAKQTGGGRSQLERAIRQLPMLYVPQCLASCDMAGYCRHQAIYDDDPSRLGRAARDSLAGVPTLGDALRLAQRGPAKGEEHLSDVAEALRAAGSALQRARAATGLERASSERRRRAKR